MNQALASALDAALRQLGDELPSDWRRIVMIKNDGPIPVPRHEVVGDAARGFNLLVLSSAGEPAYYVRCRDSGDTTAAREAEVLRRLSESAGIRPHLPESAGIRADGIRCWLRGTWTGSSSRTSSGRCRTTSGAMRCSS